MNYDCRKFNGGFTFWTLIIHNLGKTITFLGFSLEKEEGQNTWSAYVKISKKIS